MRVSTYEDSLKQLLSNFGLKSGKVRRSVVTPSHSYNPTTFCLLQISYYKIQSERWKYKLFARTVTSKEGAKTAIKIKNKATSSLS